MLLYFLYHFAFIYGKSRVRVGPTKSRTNPKDDDKDDEKVYDKSNPIRSLSFISKDDKLYALITLDRKTDKDRVNLMRSTNPDDPNSYIIAKDLYSSIREVGYNKWRINLDDMTTSNEKTVYSIQILEGPNIHQTEPFYYDKKDQTFRLYREKPEETFFTTENIVYLCLAVLAVIVGLTIGYAMCCKK